MTDPIADFLTRVRNGITAAHEEVEIPSSKLKREMARILKEQGYIRDFEIEAANPDHPGELIRVTLKYTDDRRSAITGLKPTSFDGRGNYSMGVREQIIFPEIDYDSVDAVRGLDVTITTTAETDEEAYALLDAFGMPFSREGNPYIETSEVPA